MYNKNNLILHVQMSKYKKWTQALKETSVNARPAFIYESLKNKKHLDIFGRYFFPHIIKGTNEVPKCHVDLLSEINQRKDSAIIFPRGHAKSTWIKIDTIHDIVYSLEPVILYISATITDASFHFESIKAELENNDLLTSIYGYLVPNEYIQGKKWTNKHFETTNGINVVARGAGKGRGVNIKNQRPTKIICQPQGTDILLKNKSVDISQVKAGDYVYTHLGNYKKVISVQELSPKRIYEANVDLQPRKHRFSEGHLIWGRVFGGADNKGRYNRYTKPMFLPVECFKKHDVIGFPIETKTIKPIVKIKKPFKEILKRGNNGRIRLSKTNYKEVKEKLTLDECYLLGAYLGDGSIKNNGLVFYINSKDKLLINKLKDKGKTNLVYKKGSVTQIHICSMKLKQIAESWKLKKNSWKVMGREFERFPVKYQKEIIKGYIDTDGYHDGKAIRITSVCLPLLEQIQRILLRQKIISSIRSGIDTKQTVILGRQCKSQKKYDLYISFRGGNRYRKTKSWIEGGYLWSSVESVQCLNNKQTVFSLKVQDDQSYCSHLVANHNCDDIEEDEQVRSADRRLKLHNWLYNVIFPSKDAKRGYIKMIGTVLHPYCEVLKFYKKHGGIFRKAIKNGKSLWPAMFNKKDLDKIKKDIGSRSFSQEYLNTPVNEETAIIKPSWIKTYTSIQSRSKIRKVIAVDPQAGESKTADYYGICVLGYFKGDPRRYVLESLHGRKSQLDQASEIVKCWQRHPETLTVGVEKVMTQVAVFQLIRDWKSFKIDLPGVDNNNRNIPIRAIEPKGKDKISRLQVHESSFERGEVLLHEAMDELKTNLINFPDVEHDDLVDALIYSLDLSQTNKLVSDGKANYTEKGYLGNVKKLQF